MHKERAPARQEHHRLWAGGRTATGGRAESSHRRERPATRSAEACRKNAHQPDKSSHDCGPVTRTATGGRAVTARIGASGLLRGMQGHADRTRASPTRDIGRGPATRTATCGRAKRAERERPGSRALRAAHTTKATATIVYEKTLSTTTREGSDQAPP